MSSRIPSVALLSVLLVACGATEKNHKDVTAHQTNCRAQDIEISDASSTGPSESWTAKCDGKVFHCGAVDDDTVCTILEQHVGDDHHG